MYDTPPALALARADSAHVSSMLSDARNRPSDGLAGRRWAPVPEWV